MVDSGNVAPRSMGLKIFKIKSHRGRVRTAFTKQRGFLTKVTGARGPPPCLSQRTVTTVPIGTRWYRSCTWALIIRMQPFETERPIEDGWLVP